MSKPVKRKCPQCGQVKPFRADQKTCGCPHPGVPPKVDPLVGRYFSATPDANGGFVMGRIVSRISPTIYLVSFNESFEGKEFWREKIVPLSAMCDWEVSDEDDFRGWLVLRRMWAEERNATEQQN